MVTCINIVNLPVSSGINITYIAGPGLYQVSSIPVTFRRNPCPIGSPSLFVFYSELGGAA